ncbi:hypothetical protein [Cupriavidus respiraculi]|nr:hypothetical protein [Cupriavidus respiraculi]
MSLNHSCYACETLAAASRGKPLRRTVNKQSAPLGVDGQDYVLPASL